MVERDEFQIHFGKSGTDLIQANENIRKDTTDLVIWVPEINDFFEKLQSNSADIVQGILQRSYGREFIIRDCDGHKILIAD
jgi:predicted enzyme related to lactoylglutathione lyase